MLHSYLKYNFIIFICLYQFTYIKFANKIELVNGCCLHILIQKFTKFAFHYVGYFDTLVQYTYLNITFIR